MKKPFLFKRGKIYQLQYFDEIENRIKRISTQCRMKSDALKFLTGFQAKLNSTPKIKHISLNQFAVEYEQYVKLNLSRRYLGDVKTTFSKMKESFGNIPLNKISSYQLEQFISAKYLESKFAAKHHYNNLRSAFNKAIQWGYLTHSPISKIKAPKVPKNNPSFLNEMELQLILKEENNETLKLIYLFAFNTGMRVSEIAFLKWNQILMDERNIRVMNTEEFTTKGKRERIIPMNDNVYNILSNIKPKVYNIQKAQYVFTKKGLRFNSDYISKSFTKAVTATAKKSEIDSSIHFHDLRHSFASNLAQRGVSLYVIKELLGHTDIQTTMIYSHLKPENLRNAVGLLSSTINNQ